MNELNCKVTEYENAIVYEPPVIRDPHNVVIFCHGGAFQKASHKEHGLFLSALASASSLCVHSVRFRCIDEARTLLNMMDDIAKYMESVLKKDPDTVFHLVGHSSGAYLAWMLSILLSNRFELKGRPPFPSLTVKTVTLICGYLLLREGENVTRYLCLHPAFQSYPDELRGECPDLRGYRLPELLLITGDKDTCLEDSLTLYKSLGGGEPGSTRKVRLMTARSEKETADHDFLVKRPQSEISAAALSEIADFLM